MKCVHYDPTSGMIETPGGIGKFVEYDGINEVVAVEMDYEYIVFYHASQCYII